MAQHGPHYARPDVALACFRRTVSSLWRVQCGNEHKQVLWRMAVNGLAGAGGHEIVQGSVCACGCALEAPPPRRGPAHELTAHALVRMHHAMWRCEVAQVVVRALEAVLRRAFPAWQGQLECRHLWLLHPPCLGLHHEVWALVCALALSSIDTGRRRMWAVWRAERAAGPVMRQTTLEEVWHLVAPPPLRASVLLRAQRAAVADLWSRVRDVAASTIAPKHWGDATGRAPVPAAHPFFRVVPVPPPRKWALESTLPEDLTRQLFF